MPHKHTRAAMVSGPGASAGASVNPVVFDNMGTDRWWAGMLIAGLDIWALVQTTDVARDPMTSMSLWPPSLQLEVLQARLSTLDIQAWIHKTKSPVVRIECAPGMDDRDFAQLVTSLRHSGGYAIARWNTVDQPWKGFLFAPFSKNLLCVLCEEFPVIGCPKPPTSQSRRRKAAGSTLSPRQQPRRQRRAQPQASYCPPNAVGSMLGDGPNPFGDLGQETYAQGPSQLPQAQQDQELAPQDTQGVDRELIDWPMDTGLANHMARLSSYAEYYAEYSGFGDATGRSVGLNSGSGGSGPMNGNEIGAMPSHSANSEAMEDFDFNAIKYVNWEGNEPW
ncbi:hypothetical protein BJV74DRAFT_175939 [Russula compacta]|nr:hypothetical protein BJV74DRAFT_175939 [Russula compacta]